MRSKRSREGTRSPWRTVGCILAVAGWISGCVGNHPKPCTESSDCQPGGICDGQGFCTHECRSDADCPCGSVCRSGCGLCLRADDGDLATCFAVDHAITPAAALGACRGPAGGASEPASDAAAAPDAATCLPPVRPLFCGVDSATTPPPARVDASLEVGP